MADIILKLKDAQLKAWQLISVAEQKGFITAGQTEKDLNENIYQLAKELFGIKKFWHKRIVRSGKNTLFPYKENPENLTFQQDDILFFDLGPVFEDWEADIGDTFVLGDDPTKIKLKKDVKEAFETGKNYFKSHPEITGSELYSYTCALAKQYGWSYGNEHCGHLIGNFPHEQLLGEEIKNYIHPDNILPMNTPDKFGKPRHWIYEIHFIDKEKQIGGFFEQLLTID
jgi:Xaa-Pro aminopeptidase